MANAEKDAVIKAVADLGNRVTAADVASRTGLALASVNRHLNTIAAEVGGHLEVSSQGDIAYHFKNGFQTTYLATGVKAALYAVWSKVWTLLFYIVKISFGLFLIVSLTTVVIAFSVMTVLSAGLDSEREDFKLGELLQFFNVLIVRDLLFWGTEGEIARRQQEKLEREKRQAAGQAVTGPHTALQKDKRAGNFFTNCFSFLFGDGPPNANLEETKWRLAAQTIRENDGIVIKEQLAPIVGPELDDNDAILPILSRFDGKPIVTSTGNIAYVFPSLQVTSEEHTDNMESHEGSKKTGHVSAEGYLEEKPWVFSSVGERDLKSVYMIAGLNLFGTWWLYFIFNRIFHFNFVWTELLAVYGTLFVIIPTLRHVWLNTMNNRITIRNYERQQAAELITSPDKDMQIKLAERAVFSQSAQMREVALDALVYTTEQSEAEQFMPEPKIPEKSE